MNEPKIEVPPEVVADFCRRWSIEELSLFGSVLRDDFRPDSDVDLLVTFAEGSQRSLRDWEEMEEELRAMFGRKVDLVEKRYLRNPFRRHEILRTHRVVYAA